MTHDIPEHDRRREDGDEREPTTIWGHSPAAAAVCVATGVVALLAIFGMPG